MAGAPTVGCSGLGTAPIGQRQAGLAMNLEWLGPVWQRLAAGTTLESRIIQSLLAVAAFVVLRRVLLGVLQRGRSAQAQYQLRKSIGYGVFGCAFVVVGRIWFAGFESLTTYAGLLSAGVAIALQAPLVNLAGWLFILWRKPFAVGDRVEVGQFRGDVVDQRLFMFSLMEVGNWVDAEQSTGRLLHVPNGKLFSSVLANYSQGFDYIWNEIPVLLTFESDWRNAKQVLAQIAERRAADLSEAVAHSVREAAKKYMIVYTHLTPVVYTSVKDSGVLLTIRYLCKPRRRRTTEQDIWEDILTVLEQDNSIELAYPTRRHFSRLSEEPAANRSRPSAAAAASSAPQAKKSASERAEP